MASTITIQLEPSVEARLNEMALDQNRPVSEVAEDLISAHIDLGSARERQILEGLAEFDGGFDGIPHEQVDAWLASWGTENELPPLPA